MDSIKADKFTTPGVSLKLKEDISFLCKNKDRGDHFDLYSNVPRNSVLILTKITKYCGDWRIYHMKMIEKIETEQMLDKELCQVITPITLCSEFLYDNNIVYLEWAKYMMYITQNKIDILI